MKDRKVIIGEDRLAVVLAYLSSRMPEDTREHREWARCISILSAERKEAKPTAVKCADCAYVAQCNEDDMPGGCVYKTGQTVTPPPPQYHLSCNSCGHSWRTTEGFPVCCPKCGVLRVYAATTPPPDYDPATVAFPFREELDAVKADMAEMLDGFNADLRSKVYRLRAEVEGLRGELYALSDQIGMHCREPHVTPDILDDALNTITERVQMLEHHMVEQAELHTYHLNQPHLEHYPWLTWTDVNPRIQAAVAEAFATHQEQHRVEDVVGKIQSANTEGHAELSREIVALEKASVTRQEMGEGIAKAMREHENTKHDFTYLTPFGVTAGIRHAVDEAMKAHEQEEHLPYLGYTPKG